MKVLFLSVAMPDLIMPTLPLGVVSVATAVRAAGHDVKLLALPDGSGLEAAVAAAIGDFAPDVIGLAVRNIDDQSMAGTRFLLDPLKKISEICRVFSKAPLILGGSGYSMYPGRLIEVLGADFGIRGDAEAALPAALDHLQMNVDVAMLKGVYVRGRSPKQTICEVPDMNRLMQPDPDLWPCPEQERAEVWLPFQTRRGCALDCSYCSTASIEGTSLRKRDPKTVAGHIRRHYEAGFRRFYCTDNTFNLPADYARDLCHALTRNALPASWSCIVYPYRVGEELVADMARAGCVEVSLGFENGSPVMLKNMNKRFSLFDVRHAARLFKKQNIRLNGYLLLGGPGETRETVQASLAFAESLPLDFLKITTGIRIYPATALAGTAVAEGVIGADDDLLYPRFYLAKELSGWIQEEVALWTESRPHWKG
ncbi:MAG: radical SAM protein [Deltaproteobacteria bacterium]|nr:radical SAM protein [Deltaproteobacteria bacterium]